MVGRTLVFVLRRVRFKEVVHHDGIGAAVATFCPPNLDLVRRLKMRVNPDPGPLGHHLAGHRAITTNVDCLLSDVLDTAPGAVECDHVPFPGHKRMQRVAHHCSAAVVYGEVHGVLDVNVGAKDASVAKVTVVHFVVQV
jgi:hypothetical protein